MKPCSVTQEWVQQLSFMQQSVLLTAIRGPDGVEKNHGAKAILRWYRRCVLFSAFDSSVAGQPVRLTTPYFPGGGSFTGPSVKADGHLTLNDALHDVVKAYLDSLDALPHHYQTHMMHAAQIVGYKHDIPEIREWWASFYMRLVKNLHLRPESVEDMDKRLGDAEGSWRAADAMP